MPVYHRTQRLQIFGEKPEIQKLYGSRYRMVVRCVAKNDTKAWYDDNKSQIFADFGSLYSAQMSVDGIDARTGEAYDDMVLVKNEATYTRSGEYVIIFTYETLTDSFVQETEDKVDFDLNGLKRLTRTIIAKDTVAYSSVVGTSTTGTSPLLTLAQVSEDQLEASEDGFKRIQEVWLESGTLSETIDNVGSQKAKVIETIGADPSTPSGYSLASKQESDFEGFQTKRFTFLKDNVVLSVSEDKVGSQKAVVNEVFNPTSEAITGIDTSGTALVGYSEANRTESDYEGIKTIRVQFLKPSILSLQQDFNNGLKRVSVQAFGMTDANVSAELAAITTSHALMSQTESDFEGIKTSTFQYQIDESFTEDYELNGLKRISLIELSTTNFTAISIGSQGATATPQFGLYLATQDIDNGGIIKVRESVWLEAGELSVSEESGPSGVPGTKIRRYTSQVAAPASNGIILSRNTDNTSGYKIYSYSFLEGSVLGSSPVTATGEILSYSKNIEVRQAGVVSASSRSVSGGSIAVLNAVPPSIKNVTATVSIKLVTTSSVSSPVAYNLSGTSCSANILSSRKSPLGIEQGSSFTVAVFNQSHSAISRSFPNSYHTGSDSGTITTPAQIIRDDDNIIGEALEEEVETDVTLSGSTTAPATTGIYQDDIEPAFLDADGVQYYRRTTYTI